VLTKDYRKKDDFTVRKNKPNSNPISVKPKINVNVYVIADYENETAHRPKKTNPISVKKYQNKLLLCFGVENDIIYSVVTSD
jgi:hypothetical protein